ncbi:MAG: hypothetical protein KGL39_06690 [Patescibacteria group bacterium]|nr:hypothetical protein [Patescibacteria group bacterium]
MKSRPLLDFGSITLGQTFKIPGSPDLYVLLRQHRGGKSCLMKAETAERWIREGRVPSQEAPTEEKLEQMLISQTHDAF